MTGYIITERQERIVKQVGAIAAREFAAWFGIAYPHTVLKLPDNWAGRLGEYVYATFKEEIQWRGPNAFTCEWNRAADLAHILTNEEMPAEDDHGRRFVWITIDSDHQAIVVDCLRKYADLLQSGTVVDQAGHYYPEDIEHAADRLEAASLAHLLPTLKDEPVAYTIGDHTMEKVFKPAGLTNVHDLQAVFDAVEVALSPSPAPHLRGDDDDLRFAVGLLLVTIKRLRKWMCVSLARDEEIEFDNAVNAVRAAWAQTPAPPTREVGST
jgi:hypothetical protein